MRVWTHTQPLIDRLKLCTGGLVPPMDYDEPSARARVLIGWQSWHRLLLSLLR